MNIHERMEQAIVHVPLEAGTAVSEKRDAYFAVEDDDFPITINPSVIPDAPHELTVSAETEGGLRKLLETFQDVSGGKLDEGYIDYSVQHEAQHLIAARHLGVVAARYGIGVFKVTSPNAETRLEVGPFLRLENFKTTKLGLALITGAPLKPSRGDREDLRSFGYSGIDEVAEKAMERNARRKNLDEQLYPVPLSYSTASRDERAALSTLAAMRAPSF